MLTNLVETPYSSKFTVQEGEKMDGLRCRGSSGVWHQEGLGPRRTRPWGLVQYGIQAKEAVDLWPRGRGKRKRRPKTGRGREKRKRRPRLRLHLG